jgi:hypothetical protein
MTLRLGPTDRLAGPVPGMHAVPCPQDALQVPTPCPLILTLPCALRPRRPRRRWVRAYAGSAVRRSRRDMAHPDKPTGRRRCTGVREHRAARRVRTASLRPPATGGQRAKQAAGQAAGQNALGNPAYQACWEHWERRKALRARRPGARLGVEALLLQLLHGLHDHVAHAAVAQDGHVTPRSHHLRHLQRLAVAVARLACARAAGAWNKRAWNKIKFYGPEI